MGNLFPSLIKNGVKNPNVIRNRLKIFSARKNARVFMEIQEEFGTFNTYVWGVVGGKPKIFFPETMREVPVNTADSDALSRDLKQRGMTFVGSTIMYAFMQATGLVNDHLAECFCSERSQL
jgi:DNA-3-methyladenine glycosylase I